MTDVDRLAASAAVPEALAALVVIAANEADVPLRIFRSSSRRSRLVAGRRRVAGLGRAHGFSYWQIGRALNRDHSTVISLFGAAPSLASPGLLPTQAAEPAYIQIALPICAEPVASPPLCLPSLPIGQMVRAAAARAGVSVDELRGPCRKPHLVRERKAIALAARDRGLSYGRIGFALNRDRSTVRYLERTARAEGVSA
jgi:chromosomal replication initiation ATPase DnaA